MSFEWQVNRNITEQWKELLNRYPKKLKRKEYQRLIQNILTEITHGNDWFVDVKDRYSILQLLSQIQATIDDESIGKNIIKDVYCKLIMDNPKWLYKNNLEMDRVIAYPENNYMDDPFQTPRYTCVDFQSFPNYSFFIYLPFMLSKPYISKDDHPFYIHENPVRKEWLLRTLYIPATSWKGYFRNAIRDFTQLKDEHTSVRRLLGNEKGEELNFEKGRLSFFPTFFDEMGIEVINPHFRTTGAGDKPIQIECVSKGSHGDFALLYLPLFSFGNNNPSDKEVFIQDIRTICGVILMMMTEYGFGAKSASGMGRATDTSQKQAYIILKLVNKEPIPQKPNCPEPEKKFTPETDEFCKDGEWQYFDSNESLDMQNFTNKKKSRYKQQRIKYCDWRRQNQAWENWNRDYKIWKQKPETSRIEVIKLNHLSDLQKLPDDIDAMISGGEKDE